MTLSAFELLNYDHFVFRKFIDKIKALPWQDVTRNREISWNSIRNVMLHIVECEDWWILHYIAGKKEDWKPWRYEEYDSIEAMERKIIEVQDKTREFVRSLGEPQLNARIEARSRTTGTVVKSTVEDLIFQVGTEELYHLGEIIGVLWQDGVEPPPVGYVFSYIKSQGPKETQTGR